MVSELNTFLQAFKEASAALCLQLWRERSPNVHSQAGEKKLRGARAFIPARAVHMASDKLL